MSYAEKVREHLDDCIYPAICRAPVFANELGISHSKLRRHLREEGTTWNELRNAEIQKRIRQMQGEGLSPCAIASQLGYRYDQSLQHQLSLMAAEGAS